MAGTRESLLSVTERDQADLEEKPPVGWKAKLKTIGISGMAGAFVGAGIGTLIARFSGCNYPSCDYLYTYANANNCSVTENPICDEEGCVGYFCKDLQCDTPENYNTLIDDGRINCQNNWFDVVGKGGVLAGAMIGFFAGVTFGALKLGYCNDEKKNNKPSSSVFFQPANQQPTDQPSQSSLEIRPIRVSLP